ncbi:MAG: DUF1566 domain-containing protein [Gammaproteobacteria bacterium]|uniref:Lcl C-terminal domain-containing protein n=2 Tax=Tolumonas osonensis TaxID=675874 RepID=A0A841GNE5_9GAMM|nr:hypothetical protein [Tolumonas osonensis]NCB58789.1 DUF1566 domain-containing protein [Gammaproteobacteria bacterium]
MQMEFHMTWHGLLLAGLSCISLSGCGDNAAQPKIRRNDTGITSCADNQHARLQCPVTGFPGQHESGRDVTDSNDSDGHAGFSFTKLDKDGHDLSSDAKAWSCVRDNVTGLIWEIKTTSGLQNKDATYTWYQENPKINAGFIGIKNGGHCEGSDCDTSGYVSALNKQELCGYHDWRMPNVDELSSITNLNESAPAIDARYFPETVAAAYWTSVPVATLPANAWDVYFKGGGSDWDNKQNLLHVRLVRGGK